MSKLDDLDYQILKVLMKDVRTSNAALSRMLGTSVNTVRNRIQRMLDNGALKIIGVTSPLELGFEVHVIMGIGVNYPNLTAVAEGFAKMKSVRYVAYTAGVHDLVVMAFFINTEHFFIWMRDQVSQLEGISSIKTMFVTKEVKRTYDYLEQLEEFKHKTGFLKEGNYDN